ncbi:hypothetical protein DM02DRAFT_685239 [Periconia macrospinosa]|uniref:Carrier domain-containing protein n=1 Tax=Periconia macrospinosa TaxID=97972 RepID=A0A2V1DJQ9_9PLEO|nr:hypothetical protein DM02DRAFT_685239 [Periconia macrospinosa]
MFSSLPFTLGDPGQSIYAAANELMVGLANLGVIGEVDYLARTRGGRESEPAKGRNVMTVSPENLLKLERMLLMNSGKLSVSVPLVEMRVDSLLAIEIRSCFHSQLGIDVPVWKMLVNNNCAAISKYTPDLVIAAITEVAATPFEALRTRFYEEEGQIRQEVVPIKPTHLGHTRVETETEIETFLANFVGAEHESTGQLIKAAIYQEYLYGVGDIMELRKARMRLFEAVVNDVNVNVCDLSREGIGFLE